MIRLFFQFVHIVLCTIGCHYYPSVYRSQCRYCPKVGAPIIKSVVRWGLNHGGNVFQLALLGAIWGALVTYNGPVEGTILLVAGAVGIILGILAIAVCAVVAGVVLYYTLKTIIDVCSEIKGILTRYANR